MTVSSPLPPLPALPPLLVAAACWSVLMFLLMTLLDRRQAAAIRAGRGVVPAAFAGTVTPEGHDTAARYGLAKLGVAGVARALELAAGLFALFLGFDLAVRIAAALLPPGLNRSLLVIGLLWLAQSVLELPITAWRTLRLEQRFGFNRTSPGRFARDALLQLCLTAAIGAPLLWALLLAMRDLHGFWWLWAWLGLVVLTLLAPPIYLRLVAPLFNRFEPLREPVAAPIRALLDRTGFRAGALLEMDASRRSSRGNAFVTGFGAAKRIVLFDTLIDAHPPGEIEAVVAHELGHVHHRHILFGILRGIVLLFGMCAAVGWLSRQPWLLTGFGIRHPDPALGLVLSLLLVGLVSPLLGLAGNAVSRRHEFEADAFARRMVGAEPMVAALVRLSRDNAATLMPDAWYSLVHHTHPPVPMRVDRLQSGAA